MLPYPMTKSCLAMLMASLMLTAGVATAAGQTGAAASSHATYSDDEVVKAANDFFKNGVEDLGKVLTKVLKEKGQPVAFIRGEEGGGAIGVGLRYGRGELVYKGSGGRNVYWHGPSLRLHIRPHPGKVFPPVSPLPAARQLLPPLPAAEGRLFFPCPPAAHYTHSH